MSLYFEENLWEVDVNGIGILCRTYKHSTWLSECLQNYISYIWYIMCSPDAQLSIVKLKKTNCVIPCIAGSVSQWSAKITQDNLRASFDWHLTTEPELYRKVSVKKKKLQLLLWKACERLLVIKDGCVFCAEDFVGKAQQRIRSINEWDSSERSASQAWWGISHWGLMCLCPVACDLPVKRSS